ncbi:MAG: 2-amino-4-hydroxy-6-hydroxymethyldihydropteridine diphosphokinase [Pseudomonadota bacterium]
MPISNNNVFVSLGSNIGDKLSYLKKALQKINSMIGATVVRSSSVMETSPVGVTGQTNYLNQILLLHTDIPPDELLCILKGIELGLGRKKRETWAEREIDIDIIEYEGVVLNSAELTLPHKEAMNRLFVIKGCCEVLPDYIMTSYNSTFSELYTSALERLKDQIVLDTKPQDIAE